MRDVIVFLAIASLVVQIPKRPAIGVMTFAWLSLMNPHRLAYGFAFSFPWVAIVAGLTLLSLYARPGQIKFPKTPLTIVLMVFMVWMTITTPFAFEQDRAWEEWNRVMKTLFFTMVTIAALNNEKDIKQFTLVVMVSLGFYGFKGGLFTLMSGGSSRVMGPPGTYIADNNDLALALLTIVPLIWYHYMQATNRWIRWGFAALALLTAVAVLGSYSRGAMIGGAAMMFMLWLKSRQKLKTGVVVLLLLPLIFVLMPEQWFSRMQSIGEYKDDGSAMGRVNAWHFAFNVAIDNILGGGYRDFTPNMFRIYAPNPYDVHAPHSIYFQVLGEHGFFGLALFLAFLVISWRTGSRILQFCKEKPELKWASDLAAMCQVSLAGYLVGGAFLTLAYADLLYDVVVILVIIEKMLIPKNWKPKQRPASAAAPQPPILESSRA